MKQLRVLMVLLAVGVLSAVLVSTAIAEGPGLGSGVSRVTGCQKLRVQVRQAASDVRGRANYSGSVQANFTNLHNMLVEDINQAFTPRVPQQITYCRNSYKQWDKKAKKYEALLAKWKRKGCGGRR